MSRLPTSPLSSDAPRRAGAWPAAALYFFLALVMNVPYLGMTPLAETEGHRALTGHEMARSGQWLLPMLYGRPYLAKPPLHYWIIASAETTARAAVRLAGGAKPDGVIAKVQRLIGLPNVFVWRMPSAIGGGILCAIVCLFGARWFGRTAGVVAGGCTFGMIALWGEHQVTDIDVTNTLCATITALCGIEMLFGGGQFSSLPRYCSERETDGCSRHPERNEGSLLSRTEEIPSASSGQALRGAQDDKHLRARGRYFSRLRGEPKAHGDSGRGHDATPPSKPLNNPWPWLILAGLALGGTLMTKGPAGLPIIVAVWGWAAFVAVRRDRLDKLLSPAFWLPPVIGVGLFGSYLFAAHEFIQRHGLPVDTSGLHEGLQSLYPKTLRQVGTALMLPAYLLIFSLPVSVALPLWILSPAIRDAMGAAQRDRCAAIATAVPVAWVICLLSGMVNPRYGYPSLPLLCPLAGAVAVTAARLGGSRADWVRWTTAIAAAAMAGVAIFLTYSAWKLCPDRLVVPASCAAMAIVAAGFVATRISRSWSAARWLIPIIVLASVPFGIRQSRARTPVSGIHTARYINQIAGPHPRIIEGMGLTFKPEIFYYARANATAVIPNVFDPAHVHPGTWLYMDNHEHDRWQQQVGPLLNHDMLINLGGASTYYFAWYGQPDDPAARLADHAPPTAPTARGRKAASPPGASAARDRGTSAE